MTEGADVTQDTPDPGGTNLAEPPRPQLCVTLSIDPSAEDPELEVTYFNPQSPNPHPSDPDYWDQVIDLR